MSSQEKRVYYFAYGSNLNVGQMQQRCPSAKFVGITSLESYSFCFKGYADIEFSNPDSKVSGVVYSLTKEDLARLDSFEGVGTTGSYERVEVYVKLSGIYTTVITYVKNGTSIISREAFNAYVAKIKRGYNFWSFDVQVVKNAELDFTKQDKFEIEVITPDNFATDYPFRMTAQELNIYKRSRGR